ncbi:hypothetical protein Hdeb2414_s0015g00447661 [Helianthus debilis subsp. tardiflorus]
MVQHDSTRFNTVQLGSGPAQHGSMWSDLMFGFGSTVVKLGQRVSFGARVNTVNAVNCGQTWSTQVNQSTRDPECHSCTLASSHSWNDITESH